MARSLRSNARNVAPGGGPILALSTTRFLTGTATDAMLAAIIAPDGWTVTIVSGSDFGGRVKVSGRQLQAATALSADATGTAKLRAVSADGRDAVEKTFDLTVAPAAGGGSLPAYIYNLKTSNTARLKAGLQAMQAGTRNALIHGHGHSCMAGQVANGGNQMGIKGPMSRLAAKLKLAGFATGANNLFGYHAGYALAAGGTQLQALANADSRVSFAGTMAPQGIEGPGGLAFGATDATGTMDVAFVDPTTEYDIYSTQNGGHGTYYHSVDGGTQIVVNTASPTTPALRKESVTGLAKALHTIRHGWVSGTTRIQGIEARDGTRKEISCRNFGISGIQSSSMLQDTQPYTRRSADKTLGGDCWFIMCIINDARQQPAQPTIATTKANIKAKVQDAKLAGADPVLVMEHFVGDTTTGNLGQWLDYRTALYQIADEEDCPLIDFGMKWGAYAVANAAGKMSDPLHPSFLGYDDMGDTYGAVVRWALTGVYSEVFAQAA